ncbi:LOW QUALITY PROTEIN: uncharacterized protein LOC132925040 [Rhopalosiphum padi]|uniref:LOW QUALITY PROTEIN: uncharacterized protein LOC132925040 n=1 Tax=Rhopalosiphum padi TaxID=40932 RepID=UPI00298E1D51|nr:LOW QUALITY PROTEIN: uncharacterized protein LOC132925040 [Rhopalosiphum padi]
MYKVFTRVGISACCFFGGRAKSCGLSDVQVTDTPATCTALFYNGVKVDSNYHISVPCMCKEDNQTLAYLDNLLKTKDSRRLFLYYGHDTVQEWTEMLACESSNGGTNSLKEMESLKTLLDEHQGIGGLILTGLEYDYDSVEFPGYSENLKKYLEVMKESFPDLIIALDLTGRFLIDQYTDPKTKWLDITVIDSVTNFYVVSLMDLNDCTGVNFVNGIAPMNASYTDYTLDKVKDVLIKAAIPKEKTHFKFRIHPTDDPQSPLTYCDLVTEKVCLQPQETCTWCVESLTSYNEKGNFARDYGAGFISSYIDFNDPDNCCKCEKPYSGFNAILDGFNSVTTKPCDLLNRN